MFWKYIVEIASDIKLWELWGYSFYLLATKVATVAVRV